MERIHADRTLMKVEHWKSQSGFPELQLAYQNLLGGCKGADGQPADKQHCDTKKGSLSLKYNPADPAHHIETWITYQLDGSIHASDPEFDTQLNGVLNLNLKRIRNNRTGVLSAVLSWWKSEKARLRGPVPRARIEQEIERWTASAPNLSPYCQVAVWWLKDKLAEMA
jgi:hypothetical protein